MGSLENSLPKIVKTALKEEDKVTRRLVDVLLNQVFTRQSKTNLKQTIISALDTEIDNSIDSGLIDIDNIGEDD